MVSFAEPEKDGTDKPRLERTKTPWINPKAVSGEPSVKFAASEKDSAQDERKPRLSRTTTPWPAAMRSLQRSGTLTERLEGLHDAMQPFMHKAGEALDEMSILFDPAAVQEVLSEPAQAEPASAASSAALDAREAVAEQAAEAQLVKTGGSLIDPSRIMLKDKLAFVLGVSNVFITAFWVGRWPQTYHWFWLVKDIILFTLRYMVYSQAGMHYMMLEYCYVANALSFYHLIHAPQSAALRKMTFAIMSGPLMWSIVAMRNSLVFHDGDKMTTLMMHSSPAIAAWCMRWHPDPAWTAGMSGAELAEYNSAGWVEMAFTPALLNIAWVAAYYFIIFVALNRRIQRNGYQNMFTAMVTRPSARKSALAKLVLRAPAPLQPLFYLGVHTFSCWLSLVPTKIWFDWYWMHTGILCGVLLWATWNGANFYFRVFAKRVLAEQRGVKTDAAPAAEAKKAE